MRSTKNVANKQNAGRLSFLISIIPDYTLFFLDNLSLFGAISTIFSILLILIVGMVTILTKSTETSIGLLIAVLAFIFTLTTAANAYATNKYFKKEQETFSIAAAYLGKSSILLFFSGLIVYLSTLLQNTPFVPSLSNILTPKFVALAAILLLFFGSAGYLTVGIYLFNKGITHSIYIIEREQEKRWLKKRGKFLIDPQRDFSKIKRKINKALVRQSPPSQKE